MFLSHKELLFIDEIVDSIILLRAEKTSILKTQDVKSSIGCYVLQSSKQELRHRRF